MDLKEYKAKRDFAVTAERTGAKALPKAVKGASRLVIQKHEATRLHYDFRLEMEGFLKSWIVPKGLLGKGEKHLAVEVEDRLLKRLCAIAAEPIRYSGDIGGDLKKLLREVKRRGLEGLIGKQRGG